MCILRHSCGKMVSEVKCYISEIISEKQRVSTIYNAKLQLADQMTYISKTADAIT
jgi:hypothetical protein